MEKKINPLISMLSVATLLFISTPAWAGTDSSGIPNQCRITFNHHDMVQSSIDSKMESAKSITAVIQGILAEMQALKEELEAQKKERQYIVPEADGGVRTISAWLSMADLDDMRLRLEERRFNAQCALQSVITTDYIVDKKLAWWTPQSTFERYIDQAPLQQGQEALSTFIHTAYDKLGPWTMITKSMGATSQAAKVIATWSARHGGGYTTTDPGNSAPPDEVDLLTEYTSGRRD